MSRHRILHVEWTDSAVTGTWRNRERAAKVDNTMQCHTVGLVIRDDSKTLVLAQTWTSDLREVSDTMSIPRKCITRRRHLGNVSKGK